MNMPIPVNLERLIALCRKEFLHILRDKSAFILSVISPIIMLLIFGFAVGPTPRNINIGIVDQDNSLFSRTLKDKIRNSGNFQIYCSDFDDVNKQIKLLQRNKVRAIIIVPKEFASKIKRGKISQIQVIVDGTEALISKPVIEYLRNIVADFSKNIVIYYHKYYSMKSQKTPYIESLSRVWYNPHLTGHAQNVTGVIPVIMMLMSSLLTSIGVVREKETNSYEQIIATPIQPMEFILGKLLPQIVLGMISMTILVLICIFVFNIPIRGSALLLFVFAFFFIACALSLGLLISSISNSQSVAIMSTFLLTILPSILLSGFIFSIDFMPWPLKILTYLVPARYFMTACRSLFLKPYSGLLPLAPELVSLIIFSSLFLFVSSRRFRKYL